MNESFSVDYKGRLVFQSPFFVVRPAVRGYGPLNR
jgi:hypothetical protein